MAIANLLRGRPSLSRRPVVPSTRHPARWPSYLLDVPHEDRRGAGIALDVLAIGRLDIKLPGRNVGHHLEGAPLDLDGNLLALFGTLRRQPLGAQRLELVVLR